MTFLVAQTVKNLPAMQGTWVQSLGSSQPRRPGFDPWVGKIPWRRERLPIPVRASIVAQLVKNPPARQESRRPGFDPWVRKIPWRRKWQPTPVFLPRKFHGQRSLMSYSQWITNSWTHTHTNMCLPLYASAF